MTELNYFFAHAKKEFGMGRDHEDFEQITSLPYGFKSSCWHNNVSPSLTARDDVDVTIWIDPKDKDSRECDAGKQFVLEVVSDDCRYMFVSDCWQDILNQAPQALSLADDLDKYKRLHNADDYDSAFVAMADVAKKKGFEVDI